MLKLDQVNCLKPGLKDIRNQNYLEDSFISDTFGSFWFHIGDVDITCFSTVLRKARKLRPKWSDATASRTVRWEELPA